MTESNEGYNEKRLYVINREGHGEAYYFIVNSDGTGIESHVFTAEKWPHCENVTDFGVVVIDDVLYVIGGYDQKARKCMKRLLSYNPADGTWTQKSPMFLSRSKFAVSVLRGQLYVSGGQKTDGNTTGTCETYDPATDTWTKAGTLRSPRACHVTSPLGMEIYCSGGKQGGECRNNLWINEGKKWEELDRHYPQKLPTSISCHVMETVDNVLYIAGGIESKLEDQGTTQMETTGGTVGFSPQVPAMLESSQLKLMSPWDRLLPDMNHPRYNAGSVVLGHKIYVFGGSRVEDGQKIKTSEYFDTKERKWFIDHKFKKANFGNVCCVLVKVTVQPDKPDSPENYKWILW